MSEVSCDPSSRYFTLTEATKGDLTSVLDAFDGRCVGAVVKGFLSRDRCAEVASRFWGGPRATRGVEAPGSYVGAYHYHKTTEAYVSEAREAAPEVDRVLGSARDEIDGFWSDLNGLLGRRGMTIRAARSPFGDAASWLVRSWHGDTRFALLPHDDRGQVGEPRQAGFEIQRTLEYDVFAFNLCIENGAGGNLTIWNTRPDDDYKKSIGVHFTGAPYSDEYLSRFETLTFRPEVGDAYIVRGSHVHAVGNVVSNGGRRLTVACLFGQIDGKTMVWWT